MTDDEDQLLDALADQEHASSSLRHIVLLTLWWYCVLPWVFHLTVLPRMLRF